MKSFLGRLNYSSVNEDSSSELKALRIKPGDSVLCITGSGARPLDLLVENPGSIVSLDINPCQNFLLELKLRAIAELDYERFLRFLGVRPFQDRQSIYEGLRETLSNGSRDYWDRNLESIKKGVIYAGRWERHFRRLANMIRLARPKLLGRLFSSPAISDQARFWREAWDDGEWKAFLRVITSRFVWKYFFGDPGFYRYVPDDLSIYRYIQKQFDGAFSNFLARESAFATLLFFGEFHDQDALPFHLQEKNFNALKERLPAIQVVTLSLADFLEGAGPRRFDTYSLSDIASYTSAVEYEKIWRGILKSSRKKARFCERQFLVKREVPPSVQPFIRRDFDLEQELAGTDRSIFYTFIVGEIREEYHA